MSRVALACSAAVIVLAGLAGCLSTERESNDPNGPIVPPAEGDGVRFLVIGDQGTGGDAQYAVAATMEQVCRERGCDFVIALGDNIYETGVSDEYDDQFVTKFEQPYANFSIPFYMVQGNHDNSRDPISEQSTLVPDMGMGHWYQAGDNEVAYHYRTDRESEKWQMPARYYDFTEGPVSFFAMDTNLMMFYGLGATTEIEGAPLPGEQREWLAQAVAAADTPWQIAIGHHGYLSNGAHGNAGEYDGLDPTPAAGQYIQETYEDYLCHKVDFFLNGHDHDMQWLEAQSQCGKTEQIISGAAGKTRSLRAEQNPAHFQQYDTNGFMWVVATDSVFMGVFYDVTGEPLFERAIEKSA